jgi:hypothetical protein
LFRLQVSRKRPHLSKKIDNSLASTSAKAPMGALDAKNIGKLALVSQGHCPCKTGDCQVQDCKF